MTEQDLQVLSEALGDYLGGFRDCFTSVRTFGHLGTYTRGLLSDLPRKSVEPIALHAGTPVRTLQEFLKDHVWDHANAKDLLQAHVATCLADLPPDDLGAVGLLDETGSVKKGDKTPGVQRQYLGCVGKVENGIVTVHLGVAKGDFKTLFDADLFLPEGWADDRPRCREAGIPDEVDHRPKWRIALEQHRRACDNGIRLDWLTFDEGYGSCPAFLHELDGRDQRFIGEVPRSFFCLAATKDGRRPTEQIKGRQAQEMVRCCTAFRSQQWQIVRLSRQTLQDQVWRVKVAAVWVRGEGQWSAKTYRLIWASNDETGEEKFFVSNAGAEVAVVTLMRVAFRRWNVEHSFRVCKTELGLTHFEGRNYTALMRHLSICLMSFCFVAEHTGRLRGEKSRGDDGASVPCVGGAERNVVDADAAEQRDHPGPGRHRLPPAPQRFGSRLQEEETRHRPRSQKAPTQETHTHPRPDRPLLVAL